MHKKYRKPYRQERVIQPTRDGLRRVAESGCVICGRPAEIHHVRRYGAPRNGSPVLPLCPEHHRHGGHGTAIHAGRKKFAKNYGTEEELLVRQEEANA